MATFSTVATVTTSAHAARVTSLLDPVLSICSMTRNMACATMSQAPAARRDVRCTERPELGMPLTQ